MRYRKLLHKRYSKSFGTPRSCFSRKFQQFIYSSVEWLENQLVFQLVAGKLNLSPNLIGNPKQFPSLTKTFPNSPGKPKTFQLNGKNKNFFPIKLLLNWIHSTGLLIEHYTIYMSLNIKISLVSKFVKITLITQFNSLDTHHRGYEFIVQYRTYRTVLDTGDTPLPLTISMIV